MIQINLSLSTSISDFWILDTAYGSHLCKSLQDLQKIRSLNKDDFELFGASGESIQVETMRIKILKLSSDKVLELKTCYYIFKVIKNIISVPLLLEQGFKIKAKNNYCSIYFSNKFYKNTFVDNDLLFLSLNDNVLYVDNMKKRKKEDVNITYL